VAGKDEVSYKELKNEKCSSTVVDVNFLPLVQRRVALRQNFRRSTSGASIEGLWIMTAIGVSTAFEKGMHDSYNGCFLNNFLY